MPVIRLNHKQKDIEIKKDKRMEGWRGGLSVMPSGRLT